MMSIPIRINNEINIITLKLSIEFEIIASLTEI